MLDLFNALSNRRGSNSRHPPWQGSALPAELLLHKKEQEVRFELTISTWIADVIHPIVTTLANNRARVWI